MNTSLDDLIRDYLRRLDAATGTLPPDRREELRHDIRLHLGEIGGTATSEAEVRDALERLGTPEEIAASAWDEVPRTAPPTGDGRGRGWYVLTVLALLFGGIVIPFLGWLVGLALLWSSRVWTTGEKLLGTLVWPGGLAAPLLALPALALVVTQTCTSVVTSEGIVEETCTGSVLPPPLAMLLLVVAIAAPVVTAIVLLRRAEARTGGWQR